MPYNGKNKDSMDREKQIREIIHQYCGGTYTNRDKATKEILSLFSVSKSFNECNEPTFKVRLNSDDDKEERQKQTDSLIATKLYLYDGENYIEVKP